MSFLQNHDQIGNRAFGDRLSAAPEKLALARAGLLLAPQIPMLFMGEEWGASTPFQFFVDFAADPELSRAVREGRRREFRHFAAFSDPAAAETIPDPTAEATFRRCILDGRERERSPHAEILADTRRLLAIRRQVVLPLTRTTYLGPLNHLSAEDAIDLSWRYRAGTLRFAANFGRREIEVILDPGARPVWTSPAVRQEGLRLVLPPWTALLTVEDAR